MKTFHRISPLNSDFGSFRLANGCGRALLRRTAATVLGEKRKQRIHLIVSRGIDHRATGAAHGHEPSLTQPVEVKRERIGREIESRRHASGRHALRSRLDQQAIDLKAIILRECGQRRDGIRDFHISTNIEINGGRQIISMIIEMDHENAPARPKARRSVRMR
ncbi:hypothetical protein [Bradyrhizobium canariense]|uniref:hypothetical protein n=1 Tax=Bradyrhizobium canariense TaxID=255045 RepID=UPI003D9BDE4E